MRKSLLSFLLALSGLFLFACTGDDGKPLPSFDFNHIEPFAVQVAGVEVLNHYGAAKHTADAGHLFVKNPDTTLQSYLQSRYKPAGMRGNLILEIQEASVFEFDEDADSKVVRWMNMGGFQEYNITLKVQARALDIPGFREKSKAIKAQRRVKMSEHASVAERERLQFEALEKAMHDIDTALQRSIREEFGL